MKKVRVPALRFAIGRGTRRAGIFVESLCTERAGMADPSLLHALEQPRIGMQHGEL